MAVDRALLEAVQAGAAPVVRFYRWSRPCLSLGRNQAAPADRARLERAGVDLVRRPTGGLAVLHDHELTYSVVLRVGTLGSPRQTYEAVNRGLARGLLCLGTRAAAAAAASATELRRPAAPSCFASTAPGEVLADGRKLIGSAQRCERHTLLQHGSILLDGGQDTVSALFGGVRGTPVRAITLRDLLGYVPAWPALTHSFATGLAAELGICLAPDTLSEPERLRALQLVEEFESESWTARV